MARRRKTAILTEAVPVFYLSADIVSRLVDGVDVSDVEGWCAERGFLHQPQMDAYGVFFDDVTSGPLAGWVNLPEDDQFRIAKLTEASKSLEPDEKLWPTFSELCRIFGRTPGFVRWFAGEADLRYYGGSAWTPHRIAVTKKTVEEAGGIFSSIPLDDLNVARQVALTERPPMGRFYRAKPSKHRKFPKIDEDHLTIREMLKLAKRPYATTPAPKPEIEFDCPVELVRNMRSAGLVYVLSNKAMPGLVKIGLTARSASSRADQLYNTNAPFRFDVEYVGLVPNMRDAERRIHADLNALRVNAEREFFSISVDEAVQQVRGIEFCEVEPEFDVGAIRESEEPDQSYSPSPGRL